MSEDTLREEVATKSTEAEVDGAFLGALVRTNKEIKRYRAVSIADDAGMRYKRTVEDLEMKLRRLKMEQENMLDLSPDNTHSLMIAKDFDSESYVQKDLGLGLEIRNTEIKL